MGGTVIEKLAAALAAAARFNPDDATRQAMLRALPQVAAAPVQGLRGRRLEAEDFKEQQKRVFKSEFRNTHFSYAIGEDGVERFVSTPELGSDDAIDPDPLPPGQVWGIGPGAPETGPSLYRIEAAGAVLIPVSARRRLNDLSDDMATRINLLFYGDAPDALFKALLE